MAKREAQIEEEQEYGNHYAKRQKFSNTDRKPRSEPAKVEDIHNARQLQTLLRFQQDADAKSGIQSFKGLLNSILYPTERDEVGTKKAILEEFLQSQPPRNGDAQYSFLEDVMQTWSFASQSNDDDLVTSVTTVLALLLKLLSSQLEFRQYGVNLCRTLMRIPQLRLIRRSLSAPKHKPSIISPVLRLLTELVSFDGGVMAKELYLHREYVFEPQIIAHHVSGKGEVQSQDPLRPSVRSNAIRYLLASFKYQNEGVKIDIIKQGNISRALFAHVDQDDPSLVKDILEILRVHVILDDSIPRGNKTYFLDDRNLNSILGICRRVQYDQQDDAADHAISVQQLALQLLRLVCTTPNLGVFIPCRGWYSASTDEDDESLTQEIELDGPDRHANTIAATLNVRNTTLASFIHVLRPFASEQELDLLVDIFRSAPELVADYFAKKANFGFDPALTGTWIGYAAFMFSVVKLPVLVMSENHHHPPPVPIVLESVMPRPLTQKVLTKCTNNSSDLVRFFVARLLTISLEKLRVVVTLWRSRGSSSWNEASDRLENEVAQRCPPTRDIVTMMKKSADKPMQYEASARLLCLYYEVMPWLALDEKLDISVTITFELQALEMSNSNHENHEKMSLVTLSHLLAIARLASGMQWWKKPEGLQHSPFTTLIALAAADQQFAKQNDSLLTSLADEAGLSPIALAALLKSLAQNDQSVRKSLGFIDECFRRLTRTPIKYSDLLDSVSAELNIHSRLAQHLPAVLMTIEEQLPFAEKTDNFEIIAGWVASFVNRLDLNDNNVDLMAQIRDRMVSSVKEKTAQKLLQAAFKRALAVSKITTADEELRVHQLGQSPVPQANSGFATVFETHSIPSESTKLNVLHRWLQEDVIETLDSGLAAPLLLLSSSEDSTRRQALLSLPKFLARFDPSDTDQLQHYLLLNQLQETINALCEDGLNDDQHIPYLLVTFAVHASAVVGDPAHCLYTKINQFMNEGPSWSIAKLLKHWMRTIIDSPPEDVTGNAAWDEFDWLLHWLYDGLRTGQDVDILRKYRVFEKVLAQYNSAPSATRTKILELLMRATHIEGGSTTLITRFAALDWLKGQAATAASTEKELLLAIRNRLWDTCDQERVTQWSRGGITAF